MLQLQCVFSCAAGCISLALGIQRTRVLSCASASIPGTVAPVGDDALALVLPRQHYTSTPVSPYDEVLRMRIPSPEPLPRSLHQHQPQHQQLQQEYGHHRHDSEELTQRRQSPTKELHVAGTLMKCQLNALVVLMLIIVISACPLAPRGWRDGHAVGHCVSCVVHV